MFNVTLQPTKKEGVFFVSSPLPGPNSITREIKKLVKAEKGVEPEVELRPGKRNPRNLYARIQLQ